MEDVNGSAKWRRPAVIVVSDGGYEHCSRRRVNDCAEFFYNYVVEEEAKR